MSKRNWSFLSPYIKKPEKPLTAFQRNIVNFVLKGAVCQRTHSNCRLKKFHKNLEWSRRHQWGEVQHGARGHPCHPPFTDSCSLVSTEAEVRHIFKSVSAFKDTVTFQPAGWARDLDMLTQSFLRHSINLE